MVNKKVSVEQRIRQMRGCLELELELGDITNLANCLHVKDKSDMRNVTSGEHLCIRLVHN